MIYRTMKMWERIIDRRLRKETSTGEEHFFFTPGRRTTDAIFASRQVMENRITGETLGDAVGAARDVFDLEKAYDMVPR